MAEPTTPKSQSEFYVIMQQHGGYTGWIKLPNGVEYGGIIRPQTGPRGEWFSGELVASEVEQANRDAFARRDRKMPDNLDPRSTLKPGEIKLNPWKQEAAAESTNGETATKPKTAQKYIGEFWSPDQGLFTIFAETTRTRDHKAALRGSIVEKRGEAVPVAEAFKGVNLEGELEGGKFGAAAALTQDTRSIIPTEEQGEEARGRRRGRRTYPEPPPPK